LWTHADAALRCCVGSFLNVDDRPGEPDALIGRSIVAHHDSHLVLSLRGETCPLVPAFWQIAKPSAMVVFREDCVVPFAAMTIQKKGGGR